MSYIIVPNKVKFEANLLKLAYTNVSYLATVDNIICANRNEVLHIQMDVLAYFLYHFQKDRNLDEIKLQEYVTFIRSERSKVAPNNYKIKPRKFISNAMFSRSSTIQDYINLYVLNNSVDRDRVNFLKAMTNKKGLIRKGFKEEVDLEIIVYKSNKDETNDEKILRLLSKEYDIRKTNTDEAIGMLESDIVHGNTSNDVIILVKK